MRANLFKIILSVSCFIISPDESIFECVIFYFDIFSEEGIIGGAGAGESRVVGGDGAVVLSGDRGFSSPDDEICSSLLDFIFFSYHCDVVCAGILFLNRCVGSDFIIVSSKECVCISVVNCIVCAYDGCGIGSTAGILESSDLD